MNGLEKYLPHLLEARKRLIRCLILFTMILLPLFYFSSELYTYVAQPLLTTLPPGGKLIATQVISPFTAPLKLTLFTTFCLLIPFIMYQVWAFIAPGLYSRERRTVLPFLFLSIGLFYGGMLFAHFLILPLALHFFMQISPKGVTVMTDVTHYLDFITTLYLAFGFTFQVPIITFFCIRMGFVSIETLIKRRPYIIVGAFIIGMLLTPPDVISQILLAIPLLLLFEGGLLLARLRKA